MRQPVIDVAASIVQDAAGRVLLAERTRDQVSPGFWELPGGKIDPGETATEAATRELDEEIGIRPAALRPWIGYEHAFPTKRVRLRFFRVDRWTGTPHGREGQRLAWVDPAAPAIGPLLPSNDRVLLALSLPRVLAVTGPGTPSECLALTSAALVAGIRLILVSAPQMTPDQRVSLARRVATLAHPFGARVLLEGSALEAQRAGVIGALSSARELRRIGARPSLRLWAATCHDGADLARAAALGADIALLAPILASAEAEAVPLGWPGLRALAADAAIPVYARGGLTLPMLDEALHVGAAGVAVGLAEAAQQGS